jgi:hypothetical protein
MKTILTLGLAAGLSFAAALTASAADVGQLTAVAGISAAEAASMSLTEVAAAKFNRDGDRDDQQTVGGAQAPIMVDAGRHAQLIAAAGLTPAEARGLTLSELAAGKSNASSDDDQQIVVMSSRGPVHLPSQLIAAAGLSTAEAQGLSLGQIAAFKFNRDTRPGDYQSTAR